MARVLVLNRVMAPIAVIDSLRAVSIVYRGHARFVDSNYSLLSWDGWLEHKSITIDLEELIEDKENYIKLPKVYIERPRVIALVGFDGFPSRRIPFSKRALFRRDHGKCQYCGSTRNLSIDHIIPSSKGGGTTWENCVLSCVRCNTTKGDRTPKQAGMELKSIPKIPDWLQHTIGNPEEHWKSFI